MLETNRLILRPWVISDAEELYRYAKDPEVGPVADWPVHKSVENSREIIGNILSDPETYAVILKETGLPVGSIGLMFGKATQLTDRDDECEIGFWLGRPLWGKGLMPEAVNAMLRRAFLELNVNKVWCGYFDGNLKSARVQEKCGFQYVRTREKVYVPQIGEDRKEHVTCLTKERWAAENNR